MDKGMTQQIAFSYDAKLLLSVLFLVGIGIVMVYSASSPLALKRFGNDYYFLKKQGLFALVGILALVLCRHMPYRFYRAGNYMFLLGALVLLVAVQIGGIGYSAGGAERWIRVMGLSFQPSEFARLAMIIYLSYSLAKKGDRITNLSIGFVPHVVVFGIFAVLILMQPDFGSVVILGSITWIMLFVGGVPLRHLVLSFMALLPVAYLFLKSSPYRMRRVIAFMDPWAYAADAGYQAVHSLMAFGTGGIWGVGLGNGYQKLFYLPEPHTDFIFAVIGEELGLLGVLGVIGCYLILSWKGIVAALKSEDAFACLLAVGLTMSLGAQVLIDMGVTLSLLPTKGLTLPFISYGGTSLLMNMAVIGLLMNIGKEATHGPGPSA